MVFGQPWVSAFARHIKRFVSFTAISTVILLQACGGGGGDAPPAPPAPVTVNGGAIKGPLTNALVTAYFMDFSAIANNLQGDVAGTGTTGTDAAISGLTLGSPTNAPYILEFTSDASTRDLSTGQPPVITTLRTVITQAMLDSGAPIYATPQTTMAVDMAVADAVADGTATELEFLNALDLATGRVASTLGFGMSRNVNILTTPPLITTATADNAAQQAVTEYRSAVEAMTALLDHLRQSATNPPAPNPPVTTEEMLAAFASDLLDDGELNGSSGAPLNPTVIAQLTTDPTTLPIPNSDNGSGGQLTPDDVEQMLANEKGSTGAAGVPTPNLGGTVSFTPVAAVANSDQDSDSVPDFTDNCPANANTDQSDTNNNNVGDVCDNAPVANDDSITLDEAATATTLTGGASSVTANDTDAEGDSLSVSLVTDVANGTLTLNPDGTFSYSHDGGETTSDSFTYQVSDGTSTANATVTISINPVDDAPVANDDSITVDEAATATTLVGGSNTVLNNDNDPDSALTVNTTPVSAPSNGTLTLNADGTFSYTHNGSETTTDSFTYEISGDGVTAQATVSITVNPINDGPVANNDSITVDEGAAATTLVGGSNTVLNNDTDPDSALTVNTTPVSGPVNGSLTLNADGSFQYTHNGSETTLDSFTYRVTDGVATADATVTITISPVNDAPVANADSINVDEGASVTTLVGGADNVTANDTDAEGTSLTVTLVNNVTNGTLTLNGDGTFSYTHDGTETTTDSFTYRASDGVDTADATVSISINPVDDAPEATNDNLTVDEGATATQLNGGINSVLLNDQDPDSTLSVNTTPVSGPANGSLTLNTDGTFSYTHDGSETTTDSFIYEISGDSVTAQATVNITINPVNDAPVAVTEAISVSEGGTATTLNGGATSVLTNDTDAEGTTLSADLVTTTSNGSLTLNADGTFSYTHNGTETAGDSFVYRAFDGADYSANVTVSITINNTNDAPVAVADSATVLRGNTVTVLTGGVTSVLANDTDEEGGITAVLDTGPASATAFNLNADGTFSYTHNGTAGSSDSFTYHAYDGVNNSGSVTVTISIVDNQPPVAVDDNAGTILEGGTLNGTSVLSNDTDAESDPLTANLVAGPANASAFTLNSDGTFTYVHNGTQTSTDSFTYVANDGTSDSNVATVSIAINNTNDAPQVTYDYPSITEDAAPDTVTGNVFDNDTDEEGDTLSIHASDVTAINGTGSYGTLTISADGNFSYQLDNTNPAVNGLDTEDPPIYDSFNFYVTDGTNSFNAGLLRITINGANDAPVAVDDSNSITAGSTTILSGNVTSNDTDVDGESLSVTNHLAISNTGTYGTLLINLAGNYTYELDNTNPAVIALLAGQSLQETYPYTVSDGDVTDSGTLTITINGAGEPLAVTGVWQFNTATLVPGSESTPGCYVPNDIAEFFSVRQNSDDTLTIRTRHGMLITADFNPATGAISNMIGSLNLDMVDFTNFSNIVTETSSITAGTGVATANTITMTITFQESGGCTYQEDLTASLHYQHSGSEDYSGMYQIEDRHEYSTSDGGGWNGRESFMLEFEFDAAGNMVGVHFEPEQDNGFTETLTVSDFVFEPDTGYFSFRWNFSGQWDDNGDSVIDGEDSGVDFFSGIFVDDPTDPNAGTNGRPLVVLFGHGYLRENTVGVPTDYIYAENWFDDMYARRMTTAPITRSTLQELSDMSDERRVIAGLINPTVRRLTANSKLYLQVLDAGAGELCTVPYQTETTPGGTVGGQYVENENFDEFFSSPSFTSYDFRVGNTASSITCNTDDPTTDTQRVFHGDSLTVRIVDTGNDGVIGGIDDTHYDFPHSAEVAPDTPNEWFSAVQELADLEVNGAWVSSTMSGGILPLSGYFNPQQYLYVNWSTYPEAVDSYQLRIDEAGDYAQQRIITTGVDANVPGWILWDGNEKRMRLVATRTTSNGAVARASSRRISVREGIRGLFNLELGDNIDDAYQVFQVQLDAGQNVASPVCNVTNNPSMSCTGVSIDHNTSQVTLQMQDVEGFLNGGNPFTLVMHFYDIGTGTLSAAEGVVTSPDVTGIPAFQSPVGSSTTSFRMVNTELSIRSVRYSNGGQQTFATVVNPINEAIYDNAVFKRDDNLNLFVGGSDTGVTTRTFWDGNFAARVNGFIGFPTYDGDPQQIGRFVSRQTNNHWNLGGGRLAANLYKAVLSNIADPDLPNMVLRQQYDSPNPVNYVAPVLGDVTVEPYPAGTPINCGTAGACSSASPASATGFNLSWTVPTPPAGAHWQITVTFTGAGVQYRSIFMEPDAVGSNLTTVSSGGGNTTYRWALNQADMLDSGDAVDIQFRVVNYDSVERTWTMGGMSTLADRVYVTAP